MGQQEAVTIVTVLQCSKAAVQFVAVLQSGSNEDTLAVSRQALPDAARIDLETLKRPELNVAGQNTVWYWLSLGAAVSRHGLHSLIGGRCVMFTHQARNTDRSWPTISFAANTRNRHHSRPGCIPQHTAGPGQ